LTKSITQAKTSIRTLAPGGLCCVLAVVLSSVAYAQYYFDVWTTDNSLPQNSVSAILQTREGYMWFTTLDGLVRFDGVRFTVFNRANSNGIASNRMSSLCEDAEGTLWVGTDDEGLTRYKDGEFRTFTVRDGLPHNRVLSLECNPASPLLISTVKGIVERSDEKFIPYAPEINVRSNHLMHRGASGTFWYFDGEGLRAMRGRIVNAYTVVDGLGGPEAAAMYEDRQGNLWLGTTGGLNRIKDGEVKLYTERDGLPKEQVRAIYEDAAGSLWFGTKGGGLSRFSNGKFSTITTAEGLSSNHILSIYQDREGSLWIGTYNNGLNRLGRKAVTTYSRENGLADDNVYPIYEDRAGNVWIGSSEGLSRFKDGVFTNYTSRNGLPFVSTTAVYEDRSGLLWLGGLNGLITLKDEIFSPPPFSMPMPHYTVRALLEDRAGRLWIGTDRGLVRYQNGQQVLLTIEQGLAGNDILALAEDSSGAICIGTRGGLTLYKDDRFTSYTKRDGLPSDHVRSLYAEANGTLWIGTYDGGLARLKDGRFTSYTTEDGLFNNGVFQILEDGGGNLWMSSNRGIYRVDKGQLNEFAAGKIGSISSVSYGTKDGMLSNECNGGRQPAGTRTRDGKLWFPTQKGVAVINPQSITINRLPPPVVIEEILLDRARVASRSAVEIQPGQENLEIHYTGLSFIKPEHVRFRYRLEGLDKEWVDAGTRRTAYYSHLPPGSYSFAVMAANSDGVWNTTGASVRISVRPPFWRTWWFLALSGLAVIGLALLIYERRVWRLRKAHREQEAFSRRLIATQENERKRIAAELHDGLGQSLAIIKNRAALSLTTPEDHERALEQLSEITAAATEAIDEVRHVAYDLRPYQLDKLGLTRAIQSMLERVQGSNGLDVQAEIDEIDNLFPQELEINLYRIVQESLSNILKHAQASRVRVLIKRVEGEVSLLIEDNGRGFNPADSAAAETSNKRGAGGFGLIGIRERANTLGGKTVVHSEPGKGTTVLIKFNLKDTGNGT
jgi:ligand-binding sensor domain-containing protein/signal transduction histidine kinase